MNGEFHKNKSISIILTQHINENPEGSILFVRNPNTGDSSRAKLRNGHMFEIAKYQSDHEYKCLPDLEQTH
jgi:hypothetical protein